MNSLNCTDSRLKASVALTTSTSGSFLPRVAVCPHHARITLRSSPKNALHHRPSQTSNSQRILEYRPQTQRSVVTNALPAFPFSDAISNTLDVLSGINPLTLQLTTATIAAYFAAAYPIRPRGWCRSDLLEVKESPIEGRGVFAKQDIPVNTVVGSFPGRPRTPQQMAAKVAMAPAARLYCFLNKNGLLLDPTDAKGEVSNNPAPGLPWFPVDATLAYMNEPTLGSEGVSVSVDDDPNDDDGLIFVTVRPISAGAELFVDYGKNYDRSSYANKTRSK